MKYFILKDGRIVNATTSRRAAIAEIREMQAKETHYILIANFSIIHASESDGTEAPAAGETYHIIQDGELSCTIPNGTLESARQMVRISQEHTPAASYEILHGEPEELVRYPKRAKRTCA